MKKTGLYLLVVAVISVFLSACSTITFPTEKPFVYDNRIELPAKFSTKEKNELTPILLQQLHDSIRVRKTKQFLFFEKRGTAPIYDSINADKSITFMRAYLNAQGYYRDSIDYIASIDTVGREYRTTVTFRVMNAQQFLIDSIAYNLLQDTARQTTDPSPSRQVLQQLTENVRLQSGVKKGIPFSQGVLAEELNRLSQEYRNNGFLRFSSEEFIVLWDTVGLALIRPTLDPIEQAAQLEELRRRRQNPTVDLEFRLRSNEDTSRLVQYHVGNVRVFPDLTPDTSDYYPTVDTVRNYEFVSYRRLFKPRKLVDYIYLRKGELYRQNNVLRTQNKFSALNSFRLVTVTPVPRPGQDTVDFDIKLTPARRYLFSANLETSRNLTPVVTTGNLIGVGANFSITNRNFLRAANLFTNNFRYGVELNANSSQSAIQTMQFSYSGTVQFPRRIPERFPFASLNQWKHRENVRTILGLNFAYTNRLNFFTVATFSGSWGYEKSWRNKLLNIRFPNIEYNSLKRGPLLDSLITRNRSFQYLFNRGLILSTIGNINIAWGGRRATSVLTASLELSGLTASLIQSKFFTENLFRFVKMDLEGRHTIRMGRNALAFRGFVGIGVPIPRNSEDSLNLFLPFFRQYIVGGPNSMRAWNIRRLGPGSSVKSFDQREGAPDRFGDLRIEMNGEYRFYLGSVSGIAINSALFVDVGNVWFLRTNNDFPNGEFRFNRFFNDLAIGTGTGLRIDFNFLKLRFDYAFKVKNPTPEVPEEQNKWFYKWQLAGGQLQFGIDYPF